MSTTKLAESLRQHAPWMGGEAERFMLEAAAALEAKPAPAEPANVRERWNIETDGDDLLVCFNLHEKGEKCEYERFVRAPAAPAPAPLTGEMLDKLRTLRRAAERTREDLGPAGSNYPDVRILLEFAEKSVLELQAGIAAGKGEKS